ncbi:MAG: carboxypeptidase regulatory-like domain-containing protein [Vicinamibacterales bacterium]
MIALLSAASSLSAREHAGQVSFAGVPVPGANVIATQGDQRVTTVTDEQGIYRFPDLVDGTWSIEVAMTGFAPARVEATVGPDAMPTAIALTLRSFADLTAAIATSRAETIAAAPAAPAAAPVAGETPAAAAPPPPADVPDALAGAADGLLVNGSVNNGAASPFAQAAAFGNNRTGRRSLYNGSIGVVFGTSAWDARPFSFTARQADKPSYSDIQFLGTFGGPLRIPGLLRNGPNAFFGYQRSVNNSAATQSALVPTLAQRAGQFESTITDPLTGAPFANNAIPAGRISPQAAALLALYPQPNITAGQFNYQAPLVTVTRDDNMQARLAQAINNRNSITGTVSARRIETEATSLVGLTDTTARTTIDGSVTWSRRISPFFATRVRYDLSRAATAATPHFAQQTNVSGLAGITGNDQAADNWGPPALTFSNGLLSLSSNEFDRTAATTHGGVFELLWNRPGHSMTMGGGVRRTLLNSRGQQNGRGAFSFTGAVTGSPFADFLLGLPSASAIAFGNADKKLRSNSLEAFFTDDWRVHPGLTINAGVRWEYEGPMTEVDGRLSNLDVAPDFSSATLVTGRERDALLNPDRMGIQPRLGVAWRPIPGSSLVIRGGYGIYRNTNTYRTLALLMAQQPPFSTALSVQRSASAPLTLANGFIGGGAAPATFAVDPDFKIGDAQNWQLLLQRDFPASLTASVAYLGAYGRNLMQEFLPNTYPAGAANPCPTCPSGFAYLTSNGSSVRNALQVQLRRRLRNGFTASAQYTFSKATDDAGAFNGASLGGASIAQDWRDLGAERGPSPFDQRHLFTADFSYTTGVGVQGGGLIDGIKGLLFRGWTMTSQITAGSGLPVTPVFLAPVAGTGVTGTLRASLTGAPTDTAPEGYYFNPDAFTLPAPGTWGDAGRNSLRGPAQFGMTAGLARSFEWGERRTIDWRIDATNVLNRVTYAAVNATVGSPQFGLPTRANPMRKIQTTLRLRF